MSQCFHFDGWIKFFEKKKERIGLEL